MILHISDLHCEIEALRRLLRSRALAPVEAIAFSGDAECDGEIVELISGSGKRVYFVPGNMDDIAVSKAFEAAGMNIDGRLVEHGGYTFAGIGGISFMSSIETVRGRLEKRREARGLVVISHHPPKNGVTDRAKIGVSVGLVELRSFLLAYRPIALLHGHIHEAAGYTLVGETLVVNPGPLARGRYALVDLANKTVELGSIF